MYLHEFHFERIKSLFKSENLQRGWITEWVNIFVIKFWLLLSNGILPKQNLTLSITGGISSYHMFPL